MSKITYANKVAINENQEIPDINKVTDNDMNEIKTVVNNNDDELITINTKLTNATTYSTDEIIVGTWINSKPIYRKVFNRGNNLSSFNHNIANVDLIWIDSTHSIRKHPSGNVFNIVGGSNDSTIKLAIYVNDTEVYMDNIGNLSPSEVYIALEYTKTTD